MIYLKPQRSKMIILNEGFHTIKVCMTKGKVRINHMSYTPDGGTWLSNPNGARKPHYDIHEGDEQIIEFDIRKSFKKVDKIDLVNPSLIQCTQLMLEILN